MGVSPPQQRSPANLNRHLSYEQLEPILKYATLDDAILTAIQSGKRDFTSIAYNDAIEALAKPHARRMTEVFRVVDRRLQALRKRGLIEFREKEWHMPHPPQSESK